MIYIKRFDFKKMFKATFGVLSIPFSFIGIIEILHIKGVIGDIWIKLLGIDQKEGLYYGLTILSSKWKHSDAVMWILLSFSLFLIIVQIVYFLYENRLESILLIEHNSRNQMYFKINKECRDSYIIVPYKLNQYTTFNSNLPLEEKLNIAISELENHVDIINDKIGKGKYWAGYAGIANIPMTFMLGYELGDENRKLLFHKYHGRKTSIKLKDDSFYLLKEDERRFVFKDVIIEKPDLETFTGLKLAFEAAQRGGSMPTVYNAANEKAVSLFLERKIGFMQIPELIGEAMENHKAVVNPSVEEILCAEREAYEFIERAIS